MTHLLDTATWINGVTMPQVLSARIQRLIDGTGPVGLCTVSLLETTILSRLGRLELAMSLQEFFAAGLAEDVELLEITPTVAAKTNDLPEDFQGDPFDRTIVATAAVLGLTLITADVALRDTDACEVEYYPFKPSRRRRRR